MNSSAPARVERSSNFYLGFLVLPKDKREALAAVYAFCREVDDIADSPALPGPEAARRLEGWRAEIELVYQGRAARPLSASLQSLLPRYPFPKSALLGVIGGVETDLRKSRFETYAELQEYMTGVASCVGYLCVEIFGYRQASAKDYARLLGHAFQLTNILRDIGADFAKGRVYLPLEDLRRFGLAAEDLGARPAPPAFKDLMAFEIERARALYREARRALAPEDRAAMRPAETMAGVYEALLDKIAAAPEGVLSGRVELGRFKKLSAALRGYCGGGFHA